MQGMRRRSARLAAHVLTQLPQRDQTDIEDLFPFNFAAKDRCRLKRKHNLICHVRAACRATTANLKRSICH